MARILAFYGDAIVRFFAQRDIEENFDRWFEERRKLVTAFGTAYPFTAYDPRTGERFPQTPPHVPTMPPDGRARASWECLTLVHRYSEEEWQAVQKLHRKVWENFLEEDRKRREAETATKAPAPPEPEPAGPGADATRPRWRRRSERRR